MNMTESIAYIIGKFDDGTTRVIKTSVVGADINHKHAALHRDSNTLKNCYIQFKGIIIDASDDPAFTGLETIQTASDEDLMRYMKQVYLRKREIKNEGGQGS